ncbi:putative ABC transport system ATP-binding protein [Trinickia symbiotica]|nr:ABC transporter ATP-binding protein [Trinickia symbiotica]PPK46408.1 putative ABC transport system ATP-binding protein [Trinickia symbiotica]
MDMTDLPQEPGAEARPMLELRSIAREYRRGAERIAALKSIDLTIRAGDIIGLIGPSGSGKSTLLNIAGFLDNPTRGTRLIEGKAIDAAAERTLEHIRRDRIGFVFQHFNLIPVLSSIENVELGLFWLKDKAERRDRARAMIARVGLAAREQHRPGELSGGEQQRISLARALVKEPAFVIADEPTANLDSASAAAVVELILSINGTHNTAFLIASHDQRLCSQLPRRLRMVDGVIHPELETDSELDHVRVA